MGPVINSGRKSSELPPLRISGVSREPSIGPSFSSNLGLCAVLAHFSSERQPAALNFHFRLKQLLALTFLRASVKGSAAVHTCTAREGTFSGLHLI
jgi:hypothetical protein